MPSSSCTSSTCKSKSRYTASQSSTGAKKSGSFSIQYGDGSTVSGPVYTDKGEFPSRSYHTEPDADSAAQSTSRVSPSPASTSRP